MEQHPDQSGDDLPGTDAPADLPGTDGPADVIGTDAPADLPGTDASGRSGRTRRGLAVAVGAVLLATAGGAAAWAASTTSTPTPSAATPAAPAPGGPDADNDAGHGAHSHGGFGGALHGELTVPDGASGFQQILIQHGAVTKVSATSLTVQSADAYQKTYVLTAETLVNGARAGASSLAVGDTVGVLAKADGTATRVSKRGVRPQGAPDSGMPGPGMPGLGMPGLGMPDPHRRPGQSPSASPTAPAAPTPSATGSSSGDLSSVVPGSLAA